MVAHRLSMHLSTWRLAHDVNVARAWWRQVIRRLQIRCIVAKVCLSGEAEDVAECREVNDTMRRFQVTVFSYDECVALLRGLGEGSQSSPIITCRRPNRVAADAYGSPTSALSNSVAEYTTRWRGQGSGTRRTEPSERGLSSPYHHHDESARYHE
jgi:hypothetical protein